MKKLLLLCAFLTTETAKPAEYIHQQQEIPDFPPDLPLNINNQPMPAIELQRNELLRQKIQNEKQILQDGRRKIIHSELIEKYIELIHENNIDINTRYFEKTLLEIAAEYNNYYAAQLLLEIGHADPNVPQCSRFHISPLTYALALAHYSPNDRSVDCMIDLLLSYGANIEVTHIPNEKKAALRAKQEELLILKKMKFID